MRVECTGWPSLICNYTSFRIIFIWHRMCIINIQHNMHSISPVGSHGQCSECNLPFFINLPLKSAPIYTHTQRYAYNTYFNSPDYIMPYMLSSCRLGHLMSTDRGSGRVCAIQQNSKLSKLPFQLTSKFAPLLLPLKSLTA